MTLGNNVTVSVLGTNMIELAPDLMIGTLLTLISSCQRQLRREHQHARVLSGNPLGLLTNSWAPEHVASFPIDPFFEGGMAKKPSAGPGLCVV